MTTLKKTYHHGDLNQSLLKTATDILRDEGVNGLSMRKLADKVGVSRTAPYHHFKDKNALLCAIAEQGFYYQQNMIDSLLKDSDTPPTLALFEQYVLAYIRFADQHSESYDLMYGREIWKSGQATDSLKQVSKQSFRSWLEWVAILQAADILPNSSPTLRVGQTTWATLHGLCRLLIDGIYIDRQDLDDMAKHAVALLVQRS